MDNIIHNINPLDYIFQYEQKRKERDALIY